MKWMTIRNLKKNSRYIFVKSQENEEECYLIDLDVFFWGYLSIFYHRKYPHKAMKVEERAVLHLLDEKKGKGKMKFSNLFLILLASIFSQSLSHLLEIVAISRSLLLIVLAIIALSVVIKICFSWLSKKKLFKQAGILYASEEKVFFELEGNAIFTQIFSSGSLIISFLLLTSPNFDYNNRGYGLIFLIIGLGLLLFGVNRDSIPPREGQMDFADGHGQKKKKIYWDEIEEEPIFKRNQRLKQQLENSEKVHVKGLESKEKE